MQEGEFWSGAREMTPLALGVAVYGVAFGLLAAQAGFSAPNVASMGIAVFAGSSQIVAAKQIAAGAAPLAAVLAGLALNLRLLLITASIRDVYAGRPFWQVALGAHLTTDESWALLLAARARGRDVGYPYLIGGGGVLFVVWTCATTLGVIFASAMPEPRALGMDFAFTAAFIAIARSLWKGVADVAPWLISAGVVIASTHLLSVSESWALILGGLAGAASAMFRV